MLTKSVLDRAKAFLCWDMFPDLTIKLVMLKQPVAFYYPPNHEHHTIVLFYPESCDDFSELLFLLFHECGHYLQFQESRDRETEEEFWRLVNVVDGEEKGAFERDAWKRGAALLKEYLQRQSLPVEELLERYQDYAEHCLSSYEDDNRYRNSR